MNRLIYASNLTRNAVSLLNALSADAEDMHYGALIGSIQQLEMLQEAMELKGSVLTASEVLQMDVASMLGDDCLPQSLEDLLDSYVSVRLETVGAALLSVQSRYLDSEDKPLTMVGLSMFEARRWISMASYALNAEVMSQMQLKAVA